jgi:SAM-dependent methyltransferase
VTTGLRSPIARLVILGVMVTVMSKFRCKICDAGCSPAGTVVGRTSRKRYDLQWCNACDFVFVSNPDTNYDEIYDADYYRGRGADPFVDYAGDISAGDASVKMYETRGLEKWAISTRASVGSSGGTRWLDFGCGTGSLVKFLSPRWEAVGFDAGAGVTFALANGVSVIGQDDLSAMAGTFDVVSSVEVLEHIVDPLPLLQQIYSLLKPGGIFIFTTGNSRPYLDTIAAWPYVVPEIHVSFFSDRTSEMALKRVGFETIGNRWCDGQADIYRYKILKNLKIKKRSVFESLMPWSILAKIAHSRYQIASHPVGRKPL